jgi:hypothetical protein
MSHHTLVFRRRRIELHVAAGKVRCLWFVRSLPRHASSSLPVLACSHGDPAVHDSVDFASARSSWRSAWDTRAAVVRCSGARVFRTPSHVKASLTAAIVVRSLWAALGEVWVVGLFVGWVVDRLVVCWPVVGSVVVAVVMGSPEGLVVVSESVRGVNSRRGGTASGTPRGLEVLLVG